MEFKLYEENWIKEAGQGIVIAGVTLLLSFGIPNELAFRNDMKDVKEQVALLTKDYAKQTSELKQAIKDRDYNKMAEDALTDEVKKLNSENDGLKTMIAKYEKKESRRKKEIAKKEKVFKIGTLKKEDNGNIIGPISRHILENPADFGADRDISKEEAIGLAGEFSRSIGFISQTPEDGSKEDVMIIDEEFFEKLSIVPVKNKSGIVGFEFYEKNGDAWKRNSSVVFPIANSDQMLEKTVVAFGNFPFGTMVAVLKKEIEPTFNVAPAQPATNMTVTAGLKTSDNCYALGCLGNVPEIIPSIHMDGVKALSSAPQQ